MYGNNETHEGVEAMEKDITTSKRVMDIHRFYYCILGHDASYSSPMPLPRFQVTNVVKSPKEFQKQECPRPCNLA